MASVVYPPSRIQYVQLTRSLIPWQPTTWFNRHGLDWLMVGRYDSIPHLISYPSTTPDYSAHHILTSYIPESVSPITLFFFFLGLFNSGSAAVMEGDRGQLNSCHVGTDRTMMIRLGCVRFDLSFWFQDCTSWLWRVVCMIVSAS